MKELGMIERKHEYFLLSILATILCILFIMWAFGFPRNTIDLVMIIIVASVIFDRFFKMPKYFLEMALATKRERLLCFRSALLVTIASSSLIAIAIAVDGVKFKSIAALLAFVFITCVCLFGWFSKISYSFFKLDIENRKLKIQSWFFSLIASSIITGYFVNPSLHWPKPAGLTVILIIALCFFVIFLARFKPVDGKVLRRDTKFTLVLLAIAAVALLVLYWMAAQGMEIR